MNMRFTSFLSLTVTFCCCPQLAHAEKILVMIKSSDPDDVIKSGRRHEYGFSEGQKCSIHLTDRGNLEVEAFHPRYEEWDLMWESGSEQFTTSDASYYLHLQKETGNLVIYEGKPMKSERNKSIWNSGTAKDDVEKLYINHRCILTLEEEDGSIDWRTTKLTRSPTEVPSYVPSYFTSNYPSLTPTLEPSSDPSLPPSIYPTLGPSFKPTSNPSYLPSIFPSQISSVKPSMKPTSLPSLIHSSIPSINHSINPSFYPTRFLSMTPSSSLSFVPSSFPFEQPSSYPSNIPSVDLSSDPSTVPTPNPTATVPKVLIMYTSPNLFMVIPSGRRYEYKFGDQEVTSECSLELTHEGNLSVKSLNATSGVWSTIWETVSFPQFHNSTATSYYLQLENVHGNLVIYEGLPVNAFNSSDNTIIWSSQTNDSKLKTLLMDKNCVITLEHEDGYVAWSSDHIEFDLSSVDPVAINSEIFKNAARSEDISTQNTLEGHD